jgi:hypothetical protein
MTEPVAEPARCGMSRQDAKAKDLPFYTTGKPCKRGHVAPRYAGNGTCVACQKAGYASWRDANRDRRNLSRWVWRMERKLSGGQP